MHVFTSTYGHNVETAIPSHVVALRLVLTECGVPRAMSCKAMSSSMLVLAASAITSNAQTLSNLTPYTQHSCSGGTQYLLTS